MGHENFCAYRSDATGQRIRDRRQEIGLTQAALARKLGVVYQLVQAYEHGRAMPNAQRLKRIASALNTNTKSLTGPE